jgi:hypothetical protein
MVFNLFSRVGRAAVYRDGWQGIGEQHFRQQP